MPRKREITKRKIMPDPLYNSELLARFVNNMMRDGKKSTAEHVMYNALDALVERFKKRSDLTETTDEGGEGETGPLGLRLFSKALANVRPTVEVRSRRVGGATYQVPVEVRADRSIALAIRWILAAARSRGEQGMAQRLAGELLDAIEGKGTSVKKRDDTHRMAKANQAFAHFRWN